MKNNFCVEIVYQQTLLTATVTAPCTAQEAIEQSGLLNHYPEIDLLQQSIGIFGRKITLTTLLQPDDRIEIYQPLRIDPKKARKLRLK